MYAAGSNYSGLSDIISPAMQNRTGLPAWGPGHPLYDPVAPRQPRYGTLPNPNRVPIPNPPQASPFQQPPTPSQPAPTYNPTIQTSITPSAIYTPQMTQQAVNTARALQDQQGDLRYQMKQYAGQGRSADAGTMYAAMPAVSQARSAGALAQAGIPLDDYVANQNNLLAGQIARENEATGWGGLLAQIYGNQVNQQATNNASFLSVLANLLTQGSQSPDYTSLLGSL